MEECLILFRILNLQNPFLFTKTRCNMNQPLRLLCLVCVCLGFLKLNAQTTTTQTQILWDEWGVPHIYAKNTEELFFSFGWAQMQNHANLLLRLYGQSRGRAAEYWGEANFQNDLLVHTLGFPELAKDWYKQQNPAFKSYINAFVEGLNAYAQAHPEAVTADNKMVLPLQNEDVLAHAMVVIYGRFVAGGELEQGVEWGQRGSNTYAVGPARSASGKAMLVANPHLPWSDEFTWIEAHLNAPGVHMYGATLVGLPVLGIAFNENLGWSHTNNTIEQTDLYELTLKDGGYVLDGAVKNFEKQSKVLKIKGKDGKLIAKSIDILKSQQGPVISQKGEKAIAIRIPGLDRPFAAEQWWEMGTAKNFNEFEAALKKMQIPFFNVMYADKDGNIFYLFNGQVPKRSSGDWNFWQGLIPGDQSQYIWKETHAYADLPKVKNPASNWLQNANDPPWTCTFPMVLNPKDYPPYMSPVRMEFRPQRSARMLAEDKSITYDELILYKHSTRMELADRLLDDLFLAIDQHGTDLSKQAKTVLEQWDRKSDTDSKGAALFMNWAMKMQIWNSKIYATPWSLENARTTPDGLADSKKAVNNLDAAAKELLDNVGKLDVAWGDLNRLRYGKIDLPSNGNNGMDGSFRIVWYAQDQDKKYRAVGGDSWVSVVEFGDKVRAKVLLSYGNSSQPDSPHAGDQLQLFAKQALRDARLYKEDLKGHVRRTETLKNKTFIN